MDATAPEISWLEERTSRWDDLVAIGQLRTDRVTPELAMKTVAFSSPVRVLAETASCLPLHLYRKDENGEGVRAKDHPLYKVLAVRPNSWQTRGEWVEQIMYHCAYYGASYQLKKRGARGFVEELWPLEPKGMRVEQDPKTKAIVYVHTDEMGTTTRYTENQIMRIAAPCINGIQSKSLVELGADAISLARSLEQHASSFFQNNARPGLVLTTDQQLDAETRRRLREGWDDRHGGASNAGKTAVLSNGLKPETISATNQESQLSELWTQALLACCRVTRVSPIFVQELGRATWGNYGSEMVSFEKFTMAPWLRRIEGAIARDLLADDEDLYAEFMTEGLLKGDILTRYQAYQIGVSGGWLFPEEIRKKDNLGPMPEGAEPPEPKAETPPANEPPPEDDNEEPDDVTD